MTNLAPFSCGTFSMHFSTMWQCGSCAPSSEINTSFIHCRPLLVEFPICERIQVGQVFLHRECRWRKILSTWIKKKFLHLPIAIFNGQVKQSWLTLSWNLENNRFMYSAQKYLIWQLHSGEKRNKCTNRNVHPVGSFKWKHCKSAKLPWHLSFRFLLLCFFVFFLSFCLDITLIKCLKGLKFLKSLFVFKF